MSIFSAPLENLSELPKWFWIDQTHEVIVFQDSEGRVKAFSSICPHMGGRLNFESKACKLACPWHGLEFTVTKDRLKSSHGLYRRLVEYDVKYEAGQLKISNRKAQNEKVHDSHPG